MAVDVRTCGSPLDSRNPFYHERFVVPYQRWLRERLSPSCVSECTTFVDTTGTTRLTPAAWSTCVACLGTTPNAAPLDKSLPDPRHGGGCMLCAEVVAPWALHHVGGPSQLQILQGPIPLPNGETLRTFVESGETYRLAYQAFYTLTPCQRAQWIQRVCGQGGERGESYSVTSTQTKEDPTSSTPVTQEWWFVMVVVGCTILVVGVSWVGVSWYRSRRQNDRNRRNNAPTVSSWLDMVKTFQSKPLYGQAYQQFKDTTRSDNTSEFTTLHLPSTRFFEISAQSRSTDESDTKNFNDTWDEVVAQEFRHLCVAFAKLRPHDRKQCQTALVDAHDWALNRLSAITKETAYTRIIREAYTEALVPIRSRSINNFLAEVESASDNTEDSDAYVNALLDADRADNPVVTETDAQLIQQGTELGLNEDTDDD